MEQFTMRDARLIANLILAFYFLFLFKVAHAQTTTTTTLIPSNIKLVDVCKMLDASKATGQMKTKILEAREKAGCP